MQAGLFGGQRAFEHLLDEINAPARPIELVAEQLVGRTGRGAKAAMHAFPEDRLRLAACGRVADEIGEMGFHQSSA